ncbi:MAG TPA: hypothetical protein VJT09_17910 [Pyrinomonadaceae bacterium]|nr:hypothetical protein [Pyrinomonadaceae bacterium]
MMRENGAFGIKREKRLLAFVLPFCLSTLTICLLSPQVRGQDVADKMVATVNSGVRPSLITYSDLLWQLALQPNTTLENPSSETLNRVLNLVISQRLILQEAEKLPAIDPTDEEIRAKRDELAMQFPTQTDLLQRAESVGLTGEQLTEIVRQRVKIEKYLNFRFRSFTVVTQKEVEEYYRDVWRPRFLRQQPGRLVPELKEAFKEIESELTEGKIESETDEFLDSARERAEIAILNPV